MDNFHSVKSPNRPVCKGCNEPMVAVWEFGDGNKTWRCGGKCWRERNFPQKGEGMDKIVIDARKLLGEAIHALDKGDSYNTKHPYEASFPNGAADHIRMILENIIRLDATGDFDKAVDTLGYCALYVSWLRNGCPKSEFSYISNRYMNLFKIQESKIEMSMSRNESDFNGSGCGELPQLQD